jgi:HD-GYP domain-containing protein (c-di-GMP phosphodiesterase class II)
MIRPSIALGISTKHSIDQSIYKTVREAEERMYKNKLMESEVNREMVISSLLGRLQEKDPSLKEHADRLRGLALKFGKVLALNERLMKSLLSAAMLHDIGKVKIPEDILKKPARLLADEWSLITKYPEIGYRIIHSFGESFLLADIVLSQREHWDGTGYPRGLKKGDIPFLARVLAIADAYDIMTHERPYERAFNKEETLEELRRGAGKQFDPTLVETFEREVAPT